MEKKPLSVACKIRKLFEFKVDKVSVALLLVSLARPFQLL